MTLLHFFFVKEKEKNEVPLVHHVEIFVYVSASTCHKIVNTWNNIYLKKIKNMVKGFTVITVQAVSCEVMHALMSWVRLNT